MKTVANRDIELLNPIFKEKVKKFLEEVNKNWKVIFVTEATRSAERQLELYKLWFSKTLKSNHQTWFAIDIWFFWKELYPDDLNKWKAVWKIANKYWIDWGYDLWKWDRPHFQNNWLKILQINNLENMTKYTEKVNNYIKNWYEPIFDSREGVNTLTEQEIKELIEIAFARKWK